MDFRQVVKKRRMVRNYDGAPVPREAIERIIGTARRAPSAGFSQGQVFVVVTDAGMRVRISEILSEPDYVARGFQPWFSRAPVHVVCCVDEEAYRSRYSEADKAKAGSPDEWPVPYPFIDAGASLMLMLLAAVDEGLSAGFHGFERDHRPHLRRLLAIPDEVTPFGLVTIGRAAGEQRPGSRSRGWKPQSQVIHWECWQDRA
ncbi:MAG: nitroreductase family protein [Actinomycetota bacterium]